MNQLSRAVITLGLAIIVAVSFSGGRADAQKAPAIPEPLTAARLTGTWEAERQTKGPWLINLNASGLAVTGKLWQEGGLRVPASIVDGRIDGNTVTLKYHIPQPPRGGGTTTV